MKAPSSGTNLVHQFDMLRFGILDKRIIRAVIADDGIKAF